MTLTDQEESYLDALDNRLRPLNVSVEVEEGRGSTIRYVVVTIGISRHAPRSGGRSFRYFWTKGTRLPVAVGQALDEAFTDYADLTRDALNKTDDEWDAAHAPKEASADG